MDDERFTLGLQKRRETLGAEYVDNALANADDFSRPLQEAITEFCWGFAWGDAALNAKTRSLINLGMIAALGKMAEWELHCRGAIKNGVSEKELRAVIHIVAAYCGIPAALSCLHSAQKILKETKAAKNNGNK
ncbi:MAG: carboxymuconolactone decarboxylase family protein [Gammaproteobacteria bacterium]